ncbi:RHS repeat protein, partial [Chitinimonas sp. BJB300]
TVTQFERDAHGNAVRTTRFANTMTLAGGAERPSSVVIPASHADDRIEQRRFDLAGHQTEYRVDLRAADGVLGNQILQKTFYDKFGRTALEWQAGKQVGGNKSHEHPDAGVLLTTNLVKAFEYDRAGNQISTKERISAPGVRSGGAEEKKTEVTYNAFGEITERKLTGITTGTITTGKYEYDNAGRLWRKQEAGVWSVHYYNRMGWEVARVTSPIEGTLSGAITPASLAQTAVLSGNQLQTAASTQYRRTYTNYDKLGRQIGQTGPAFTSQILGNTSPALTLINQGGKTVIPASTESNVSLYFTNKVGQFISRNLSANQPVAVDNFGLQSGESILLLKLRQPSGYVASATASDAELIHHAANIQHYRLSRINDQYSLHLEEKTYSATYRPTTQTSFDRWGNRIGLTDASRAETRWHYNSQNQLQDEISATVEKMKNGVSTRGQVTKRYAYSHAGDLIGSWDGNGNLTRQQFDAFGRLVRTTHGLSTDNPTGWAGDEHVYDMLGRLAKTLSNIGDRPLITTYVYNRLDQRILERRQGDVNRQALSATANPSGPNWTSKVLLTHYGYDSTGNRVRENRLAADNTDIQQTTWYAYGTHGKVTNVDVLLSTYVHNTVYSGTSQEFTYDLQGNKTKESTFWRKDKGGYDEESKSWTYDLATNRLTSHTDLGGNTYNNYRYNGLGQVEHFNYTVVGKDPITRSHLYDQAGQLISQTDTRGMDVLGVQRTRYDVMGRISFESMARPKDGSWEKDNAWFQATDYDALGRVQAVYGKNVATRYGYDANSNRTYVQGMQRNADIPDQVHHYSYDALNRVVVSRGSLKDGSVVETEKKGERFFYRGSSQLHTGVWRTTSLWDSFTYDSFGQLVDTYHQDTSVSLINVLKTRREYNYLGQMTLEDSYNNGGMLLQRVRNAYEVTGQGRLARQETHSLKDKTQAQLDALQLNPIAWLTDYSNTSTTVLTNTYEGSRLAGYEYIDLANSTQNQSFTFQHQAFESWRETSQKNSSALGPGTSTSTLDDYGNTIAVSDPHAKDGKFKQRDMLVDFNGRVLQKTNDNLADKTVNYLYVGGNTVASSFGAGEEANFDYASAARTGTQAPSSLSVYTVNKGDTLRSIAFAVWGDGSLWYLIGDENGLTVGADADPGEGRTLRIPNAISAANNASTFAPYNPGRLVGDTTPTLPPPPPPPKKKRWSLGSILMVAVAIAVTVYTAGAASTLLAGSSLGGFGATMAAGASAMTGTLAAGVGVGLSTGMATAAAVGGAMIGAAAGSIASQGFGLAIGEIDEFKWSQVGTAALSAGVTAGAGSALQGTWMAGNGWMATSARAAVSTTASQSILSVAGLSTFSWRNVAAAGIAAPITQAIGDSIFGSMVNGQVSSGAGWAQNQNFAANYLNGLAGGVVNRVAQIAVNGRGRLDFASVAANAFGDVLGNSIAGNNRQWVGVQKPKEPDANTRWGARGSANPES